MAGFPGGNISTRWYTSPVVQKVDNATVTSWATGQIFLVPILIYRNGKVEAMGVYKSNTTNNGDVFRLGIYSSSSGLPNALITEFGTVSFATGVDGIISATGTATVTKATTYWLAVKLDTLNGGTHATAVKAAAPNGPVWAMRPWGFSGTNTSDFAGTSFTGVHSSVHTSGHGTGALPSSLSGASFANDFILNIIPFYTYKADPEGEGGWGWHGSRPYWQVIG